MKKHWLMIGALAVLAACSQAEKKEAQAPQGEAPALTTEKAKFSYAIGLDVGHSLKRLGEPIDEAAFALGVKDALSGAKPRVSPEEAQKIKAAVFRRRAQAQAKKQAEQAQANAAKAKAFLEKNAKAEGVQATPSGLQYKVLREGKGERPGPHDLVRVHYEGRLADGTVFDSSYQRGQPAVFALDRVIKGFAEGIQLMRVGAKYRFWIPPELGYGEHGAPPRIPPNAVLVFDVELLGIEHAGQKPQQPKAPQGKQS